MAGRQRISYVGAGVASTRRCAPSWSACARFGTPRPESQSVRAHVPAVFWSFANTWQAVFREGVCDHTIKELCRVYVSRTVKCEYCGNQRSVQASAQGLAEGKYDQLLNFETSDAYDERQKAALAYAEAITWRLDPDDAFWERLSGTSPSPSSSSWATSSRSRWASRAGCACSNIEHHSVLAGDSASMAPGFETPSPGGAARRARTTGPSADGAVGHGVTRQGARPGVAGHRACRPARHRRGHARGRRRTPQPGVEPPAGRVLGGPGCTLGQALVAGLGTGTVAAGC